MMEGSYTDNAGSVTFLRYTDNRISGKWVTNHRRPWTLKHLAKVPWYLMMSASSTFFFTIIRNAYFTGRNGAVVIFGRNLLVMEVGLCTVPNKDECGPHIARI